MVSHTVDRRRTDTGVVAQHVARAEPIERGVGQAVDRRRIGDVGVDPDDLTGRAELAARGVERTGLDVGDDDLHPLGDERAREREPDPRRAAGDDGDASFECLHGLIPRVFV